MALPKMKVNVYKRRIALFKKRIDNVKECAALARIHYSHIVAKHIAEKRGLRNQLDDLTTAAIQDRFKIQDFEAQIANQWRENAELRDDLARAKLSHDAKAKELQQANYLVRSRGSDIQELEIRVERLQRSLTNRIWSVLVVEHQALRVRLNQFIARRRIAFAGWKSRIVHRWMIRRLSKARVAALYEAGHIPDKLVRSALAYYEHDKKRLDMDEQIRDIHYGPQHTQVVRATRPPLWRRIKIWMGRA